MSLPLNIVPLLVASAIGLVISRFHFFKKFPTAPGPRLALVTRLWYALKIWDGHFEEWNVRAHAEHGRIVRVAPNYYSIDDPAAVKILYSVKSPMVKSSWYAAWGDPSVPDHNLFSARNPQKHAMMRRKAAQLYSMTNIKTYEPFVDECMSLLLCKFDQFAATGEVVQLQHWMQCYAFDVIGAITYGERVGFLESGGHDVEGIMKFLDKTAGFSTLVGVNMALLPLCLLVFGSPIDGVVSFSEWMTQKIQQGGSNEDETSLTNSKSRPGLNFNQKLSALKAEMSEEEFTSARMKEIAFTNVAAGSDTTGLSLTAILYHLVSNPIAYGKLRKEIAETVQRMDNRGGEDKCGDHETQEVLTFEQVQSMPYLQMVVKEGLRIHPATGLPMWRDVPEGGATVAGTYFPKGSTLGINAWVAHHNTSIFGRDAASFRPERWDPMVTPKSELARMEGYYIPFGAGTRTCIGKNISIMEICKLIPMLVQRYDFEIIPSPPSKSKEVGSRLVTKNMWFVKPTNVSVRLRRVGNTFGNSITSWFPDSTE